MPEKILKKVPINDHYDGDTLYKGGEQNYITFNNKAKEEKEEK